MITMQNSNKNCIQWDMDMLKCILNRYKNLVQINIYFSLPQVQKINEPNSENLFSGLVLQKRSFWDG
jgi:hypothetical protein